MAPQNTGPAVSPTQSGLPPIRVPTLLPEKVNEYSSLFEKSGAENGVLSGIIAKQIFERARLPNEVLGRIWNLADTQGRGALNITEFAIAMHLLASYKSGAMRGVPQTLPPGLFEAAAKRIPTRTSTGSFPGAGIPAVPPIPPQFTGMSAGRPQTPILRQQVGTPLSAQSTGDGWAITPADKARFDQLFNGLDKSGRGFITGDQAVDFFGNARLPEESLAQIWDLADINSEGRLNRDEFAVAMYLIRQQRGTKEGRGNLPATLPPALVPPMMRKQQAPPSQPTAPAFENAPVTKPRSAADDLFGLDAFTSAPTQVPQSTGGSATGGPFQNPISPLPPPINSSPGPSTNFKPFVPSSSFGQSIAPQQTGLSTASNSRVPQPSASDDLLGDADPEISQRLTSEASDLGNLSNQVGNLSKQMQEVQGTRKSAELELSQGSQQKKEFENRLAQLRIVYEKEVKEVKILKEQLSTQRNDLKRLQQDMAMLEGGLQDLQSQRQQLSTALEAELREKATLNEKIKATNNEINELKPQVEKLKSEARQQKGLVAISKKQLATIDMERDRLQDDLNTAKVDLDAAKMEVEEQARSVPQASPVPRSANVTSPAASVMSATNPFFRRGTGTSDATFSPAALSRQQTTDRDDAFDSMFGPSFAAPTTSTPPPTSFEKDPASKSQQAAGTEITPSTSPFPSSPNEPLRGIEPPPPPSSRQITSSALPFRPPLERADSISSSVRVAPPASRLSPAETPKVGTPSASTSSVYSQNGESPVSAVKELPSSANEKFSPAPPFEQGTPSIRATEAPTMDEESSSRSSAQDIPGAFPQSDTPRIEAPPAIGAATIGSRESEKSTEPEKKTDTLDTNFDQYFGGPAHSRSPSQKAADFDSAFANFKPAMTNGTGNSSKNEFPPIRELDDDATDNSSEAPTGFDDDFIPASHARQPKEKEVVQSKPEVASAMPASLQARPVFNSVPSTNSSLPDIGAQTSPPTYGESLPRDNPDHFPPEFQGLLPHRGDPTSPDLQPPNTNHKSGEPANNRLGEPFTPEPARSPQPAAKGIATSGKAIEDDFDSAFTNMAPAPVIDDDDDEDDFGPTFTTNHNPEFDPTFDSPAPSKSTIATLPPAATSHFSSTMDPKSTSKDLGASRDLFDFSPTVNNNNPPLSAQTKTATLQPSDWDDMFAGLDNSTTTTSSPPAQTNKPSESTTRAFSSTPPHSISTPIPPPTSTTTTTTTTQPDALKQNPAVTTSGSSSSNRPTPPGRALTTGTEHDDPILKRLTSMGWSRDESLQALELFDYNLDKVSFFPGLLVN
jgi:epidermal growth factor receptor substrate 15